MGISFVKEMINKTFRSKNRPRSHKKLQILRRQTYLPALYIGCNLNAILNLNIALTMNNGVKKGEESTAITHVTVYSNKFLHHTISVSRRDTRPFPSSFRVWART